MSHWTKVTVEIREREKLKKVLKKLGLNYQEGMSAKLKMKGYAGNTAMVDMTIDFGKPRSSDYKVGLNFNVETGKTEVIADWWGLQTTQEKFTEEVVAPYAEEVAVSQMISEGYLVADRQQTSEGVAITLVEPL